MTKDELKQLVVDYAYGCGIDPRIALAQIKRESADYRPDVVYGPYVGGAGERGMSQFTKGTWDRFGYGPHTNAYDPEYAMSAWCAYMAYLNGYFDGDMWSILAGYNGGEGNVTNGTISEGANRYASEILTQADAWPVSDIPAASGNPATNPQSTDWRTVGLAAALVLGLMFVFRR